jgi:hypothetical protein
VKEIFIAGQCFPGILELCFAVADLLLDADLHGNTLLD